MPRSAAYALVASIIAASCVAIAGIGALSSSSRISRTKAASTSAFCWKATVGGSLYAPLTSRTRAPSSIIRRTSCVVRRRYDCSADADVAVALLPQRLEHFQRDVGVARVLHVDAHEEPVLAGGVEDAPQVVHAGGAIDVEPELRQLERDVALDAGAARSRR